jgi:hypothetical protein
MVRRKTFIKIIILKLLTYLFEKDEMARLCRGFVALPWRFCRAGVAPGCLASGWRGHGGDRETEWVLIEKIIAVKNFLRARRYRSGQARKELNGSRAFYQIIKAQMGKKGQHSCSKCHKSGGRRKKERRKGESRRLEVTI